MNSRKMNKWLAGASLASSILCGVVLSQTVKAEENVEPVVENRADTEPVAEEPVTLPKEAAPGKPIEVTPTVKPQVTRVVEESIEAKPSNTFKPYISGADTYFHRSDELDIPSHIDYNDGFIEKVDAEAWFKNHVSNPQNYEIVLNKGGGKYVLKEKTKSEDSYDSYLEMVFNDYYKANLAVEKEINQTLLPQGLLFDGKKYLIEIGQIYRDAKEKVATIHQWMQKEYAESERTGLLGYEAIFGIGNRTVAPYMQILFSVKGEDDAKTIEQDLKLFRNPDSYAYTTKYSSELGFTAYNNKDFTQFGFKDLAAAEKWAKANLVEGSYKVESAPAGAFIREGINKEIILPAHAFVLFNAPTYRKGVELMASARQAQQVSWEVNVVTQPDKQPSEDSKPSENITEPTRPGNPAGDSKPSENITKPTQPGKPVEDSKPSENITKPTQPSKPAEDSKPVEHPSQSKQPFHKTGLGSNHDFNQQDTSYQAPASLTTKEEKPDKPTYSRVAARHALPKTGESTSLLSLLGLGVAGVGLSLRRRRL